MPFSVAPNTFGYMLNLDWFQPYEDSVCGDLFKLSEVATIGKK